MNHVFWVIQDQLCGRPGPNHAPWDAVALQAAGVDSVLSVNNAESVYPEDFTSIGMSYRCIPLAANAPPREGDLEICLELLPLAYEFVHNEIELGKSVLVHCRHGKDRTGLFMAYFLRRQFNLETMEAIKRIMTLRPIALSAHGWDEFAKAVLDSS